jgi:uncharacterized repeat protein (TIGR02543 family)
MLAAGAAMGQTPVLSETFEGGSGATLSGWTFANGGQENVLYVGTAASNGPSAVGTKAAYITHDNGATNTTNMEEEEVSLVYLYRSVTFPAAGGTASWFKLSFDIKTGLDAGCEGKAINVYLANTDEMPTAGENFSGDGVTYIHSEGVYNVTEAGWRRVNVYVNSSYAELTKLLVFGFYNYRYESCSNQGAAIDNVTIEPVTPVTAVSVTNARNSGAGSLREAMEQLNIFGGGTITFDPAKTWTDSVITLTSALPYITKNLTIEGNGVTISGNDQYGILIVDVSSASINISRIHFTHGRYYNGGAIFNNGGGNLSLSSCIFSYNQAYDSYGGAIMNHGTLNARGCTFYGNSAPNRGGALYNGGNTLTLTGNLFYGNTTATNNDGVVYNSSGTVTSGGYNVSDKASGTNEATGSGYDFLASDKQETALPVSSVTFRLLSSSGAAGVVTSKPTGYPDKDFYGSDITAPAAAGAVQATASGTGYVLAFAAAGPGEVALTSGSRSADGIVAANGSVTLTATPAAGSIFRDWTVNGEQRTSTGGTDAAPALTLTVSQHTAVTAAFGKIATVTNARNSGAGSLREAITQLQAFDDGAITFDPAGTWTDSVITLASTLPYITKNLTIEGNGVTISGNDLYRIMYISSSNISVNISRVHFTHGRYSYSGGAIGNSNSALNLSSCIFSYNQAVSSYSAGGAIYNYGTLNVRGCTFYGNSSSYFGGAIYNGGTLTLTGNLFYGNTAISGGNVVYGTVTSGGYNVSDKASGTNSTTGSGYTFLETDKQVTTLSVSPISFRVLSGSSAAGVITGSLPAGYPAKDFYGSDITASAAAGAVQATASGMLLVVATDGPGEVSSSAAVNSDGLTSATSATLTASAGSEGNVQGRFLWWTVNGTATAPTNGNQLVLSMDGHKEVRALFARDITVTNARNSGAGSLREAIGKLGAARGNAPDGIDGHDRITFNPNVTTWTDSTITLSGASNAMSVSGAVAIDGKGVTISGNNASQIMNINGDVEIKRVHFTRGRTSSYGGAIYSSGDGNGKLSLNSCIFSYNTSTSSFGGAVYSDGGVLTVCGCTFYGNTANSGGAIYNSIMVNLTGNLFYSNTAANNNVAYGDPVTSGGYNVSDRESGTNAATGSGYTFLSSDKQETSLPVSPVSFRLLPGSEAAGVVTDLPTGYPEVDFYGAAITAPAAAGAVQTPVSGTGKLLSVTSEGLGTVSSSPQPDGEGLTIAATVTLTATALTEGSAQGRFLWWTVNDSIVTTDGNELELTMNNHKVVRALFAKDITVTNARNSGAGSLREAVGQLGSKAYTRTGTQYSPFSEDFESGSVTTLSGWTFANGSYTNKWIVGTGAYSSGSKGAYITNVASPTVSSSNAYSITSTSNVHLYRDVTFPASTADFTLTFNYRCYGNSDANDVMQVYLAPTTVTPTAGSEVSSTYRQGSTYYSGQSSWQTVNITLSAATYAGTTQRLVFSWKNNISGGSSNPAAIDNVSIQGAQIPFTATIIGRDNILFDPAVTTWADSTITLSGSYNAMSVSGVGVIDGKGVTISGNGASQIMSIGSSANVEVKRVRFTRGYASTGGAIYNGGTLSLQSCIFSYDTSTYSTLGGGAIYNYSGTLAVKGCTFYRNGAAANGGAVWSNNAVTLAGNLLYGNRAASGADYYQSSGTATSGGYNAFSGTRSGLTTVTTDKTSGFTATPFSLTSYRLKSTAGLAGTLTALPAGYPALDFYGDPIAVGGAPGAVQSFMSATGCELATAVQGSGAVAATGSVQPDADGMVPQGSTVTLSAVPSNAGSALAYWVVNGAKYGSDNPLTLTVGSTATTLSVQAVFGRNVLVTNRRDVSVSGTLRYALTNAQDNDVIRFNTEVTTWTDSVITLTSSLPSITKILTIEGNGVTISSNGSSGILSMTGGTSASPLTVTISRVRFSKGNYGGGGGAIYKSSNYIALTLQSCIFDGNRAASNGGAIYNSNSALNVYGCTFYDNSSPSGVGGAIYTTGSGVVLRGNVFYGNTERGGANSDFYFSTSGSNITSGGGNVFGGSYAGLSLVTSSDRTTTAIPLSPLSYKPLQGSLAVGRITTLPEGYPSKDFYGNSITAPASAGAVQEVAAAGYLLSYAASPGSAYGSVSVTSGSRDADGVVASGATVQLTATASTSYTAAGGRFIGWTVNGIPAATTGSVLELTMNEHKTVQAVFGREVTVTNTADNNVSGSLRYALNNARDGDVIRFSAAGNWADSVITLTSSTPLSVSRNVTIEGSGVTISGGNLYRILSVSGNVTIRRVHFTGGKITTYNYGGGITSSGSLTLESCIFSSNAATYTSSGYYIAGAIYNSGLLNVRGCTFYDNSANGYSATYSYGAIFNAAGATATLTGNIFYRNTSLGGGAIISSSSTTVISGGYNVYDIETPGFTALASDRYAAAQPVGVGTFRLMPGSPAAGRIATRPTDYPAADFYGSPMTATPLAAGAVQASVAAGYIVTNATNPARGTVAIQSATNADGITFPQSVAVFTVTALTDYEFNRWQVNGENAGSANPLTLTVDTNLTVQAIFTKAYVVANTADAEEGSLREALQKAAGTVLLSESFEDGSVVESTVLLNETFEAGSGASLSGWTFANGTQTNKWTVGTGAYSGGSKGAYITNDATPTESSEYAYSHNTSAQRSYVHLYRDVTFPASSSDFTLTFKWKGAGYSSSDYLQVLLSPTSVTPTAGSTVSDSYRIGSSYYYAQSTWQTVSITLPAATYAGTTQRLVFSWRNTNYSSGYDDGNPAAIDDVVVQSAHIITLPNWTIVNGSQPNRWTVGTGASYRGSKGAYITSDAAITSGSSNSCNSTQASIVHLYRDVTFPISTTDFTLTFRYRCETGVSNDYLRAAFTSTSTTLVAGSTGSVNSSWSYNAGGSTWQTVNVTLSASTYAGTTQRLVFTWRNATSGSGNPAAIDGVTITSGAPITNFVSETFESGSVTTLPGWTFANGSQTNKWIVGTSTYSSGSKSAYITNAATLTESSSNSYTVGGAASTVHLYRDVTFPASSSNFTLTFRWRNYGNSSYAYLRVSLAPTTVTPAAGSIPSGATQIGNTYSSYSSSWASASTTLSAATYAGKTMRLIFSWVNTSGSSGNNPPAAIDNIAIAGAYWASDAGDIGNNRATIYFADSLESKTITLSSALPAIDNLDVQGNGVTVSGGGSSQILPSVSGNVSISNIHFTRGLAGSKGGAISNSGTLALKSCVFSRNNASGAAATDGGGAVYNAAGATLSVMGCTFYDNGATYGGAIRNDGSSTLTGNLFFGNHIENSGNGSTVYKSTGTIVESGGYNVFDEATSNAVGFTIATGDLAATTALLFNTTTFVPTAEALSSTLLLRVPSGTAGFPTTDFYGVTRSFPSAAGAVAATGAFTVTYNLQYGNNTNVIKVAENALLTAPAPAPIRTGYTFGGWYREAALATAWNFATDAVTANVTLYAKWTATLYTVTFSTNEGSAVTPLQVAYGGTVIEPSPAPTRTDYNFGGWYRDDATFNTPWNFATDVVMGNVTLYARWIEVSTACTVTFNANGGSTVASVTVASGEKVSAPTPAPTKSGYTFGGWYKEAALTTAWSFTTDVVTANITLYAKWTEAVVVTHTVTFNANNGSAVTSATVTAGNKVSAPTPTPTKSGYTFGGWYRDDVTFSTLWSFATDVVNANLTLYAKWIDASIPTSTVTFNANNGSAATSITVATGDKVSEPTTPTKSGYTFGGWYRDDVTFNTLWNFATDVVNANLTLYAKWIAGTAATYMLIFDAQSGIVSPVSKTVTQGVAVGALPTPTRSGYTFDGWYTAVNGAGTLYTESTTYSAADNLTLYAKWTQTSTAVAAQEASELKLYPNPVTNGKLRIEGEELKAGERVEIYSLLGTLVGVYEAGGRVAVIDVSPLAAGAYIVKVGRQRARIVVK